MQSNTNQTLRIQTHQHYIFTAVSIRQRSKNNTTQHDAAKIYGSNQWSNVPANEQILWQKQTVICSIAKILIICRFIFTFNLFNQTFSFTIFFVSHYYKYSCIFNLLSIAHKSPFRNNIPPICLFKMEFISINTRLLTHTMILAVYVHMTLRILRDIIKLNYCTLGALVMVNTYDRVFFYRQPLRPRAIVWGL